MCLHFNEVEQMKPLKEIKTFKPAPVARKQINIPGRHRALLEEMKEVLGAATEAQCIVECLLTIKAAHEAGELDV